jgi:hypothetical protein
MMELESKVQAKRRRLEMVEAERRRGIGGSEVVGEGPASLAVCVSCTFDGTLDIAQVPARLEVEQNGSRGFESFMEGECGTGEKKSVEEEGGNGVEGFAQVEMPCTGQNAGQDSSGAR